MESSNPLIALAVAASDPYWGPVYSLGRLVSKFIIMDCLGFAGKSLKIAQLMHGANRNLRKMLIKNFKSFKIIVKKQGVGNLQIFDHTAQEHYGINFKIQEKIREHCFGKQLQKARSFKLEQRAWVTNLDQRREFFTFLAESVKPPFLIMSYSNSSIL
jgi:hypothetical protein